MAASPSPQAVADTFTMGSLLGPAVVAALVSGIVTTVGFVVNRSTSLKIHERRLDADRALAERKVTADIVLAERKFELDRKMADWKRKSELAEEVLADFYKAHNIFRSARQPMSMGSEGSTRPRREGEYEDEARMRDAIYTPYERLSREREFLADLHAKQYRVSAAFGLDAAPYFQAFVRAHNLMMNSTSSLLREGQRLSDQLRAYHESVIGWGEDDTIGAELDKAVVSMEEICKPVLQWKPT